MTAAVASSGPLSVDRFLGGRLEAIQPMSGHHRAGLEAVLLSAAIENEFFGTIVDLGAGVGVAGMAVAARCPGAHALLVERDPEAVACARAALARGANRSFADRVSIAAVDIVEPEAKRIAAGLGRAVADAVVMNPPFNDPEEGTHSPDGPRAAAHVLAGGGLDPWLRAAASALKPNGRLVVVFRADRLGTLLAALGDRFGHVAIMPLHARATLAAHRVLVSAVKGSRAAGRVLPGLTLHDTAGPAYLPAVDRILRDGADLATIVPAWGRQRTPAAVG